MVERRGRNVTPPRLWLSLHRQVELAATHFSEPLNQFGDHGSGVFQKARRGSSQTVVGSSCPFPVIVRRQGSPLSPATEPRPASWASGRRRRRSKPCRSKDHQDNTRCPR